MPPRRRNPENAGLPKRWRFYHGAYFYQVPKGQEHAWDGKRQFKLGDNLADAFTVYAQRIGGAEQTRTVAAILDRYAVAAIPRLAPATRESYARALPRVRRVFGHLKPTELEPWMIYKYVDKRVDPKGRPALTAAHREIEVLSSALSAAIEWGDLREHPFKGQVRLARERGLKPRTRYIEDWEVLEALALPSRRKAGSVHMVQAYIRLKLLTGMRKTDLLKLRVADADERGIHYTQQKTGGPPRVIEWSDELRAAWSACLDARPVHIAPLVFCTAKGRGYLNAKGLAPGFTSVWQRFMARLLDGGKVRQRFTEHDLRAKAGSDAESLERARQLLGHADARVTSRVYRRAPEVVRPLK